jgi:hypothetical protein
MGPFYELYYKRFLKQCYELLDKVEESNTENPLFGKFGSAQVYNNLVIYIKMTILALR